MMKWLCLLTLGLVLAGCSKPAATNELVVGMDLTYPPFETIDQAGKPQGVSVELAKALAAYLGKPLRIEAYPFAGLIPALKTKKIDCIISSMTDTEERRNSISFSDPYLTTGLAMLTGKQSGILKFEDADKPGKTIAVRQGTTGEAWARTAVKNARLLSLEKESGAVLEVIQGKADVFIYDQMSVWQNWRKHPDATVALLNPIRIEKWAIGMRLDEEKLRGQVNAFLKQFQAQGGFEKLGDQFLSEQKKAFGEQGIPFYF